MGGAGSHGRLCEQVEEGEKKQLDLSVLRASDLDVPPDELRFSLIRAPRHGSIARYGAGRLNATRKPVAGRPKHPEPVLDFTLQELQNGTSANRKES